MHALFILHYRSAVKRRSLSSRQAQLTLLAVLLCAGLSAGPFESSVVAAPSGSAPSQLGAAAIAGDHKATNVATRFLEDRVKRDPDDFGAQNRLAGLYLRHLRETGNYGFIALALGAARASLAAVPPERNVGGLTALAMVESASHSFAAEREHAVLLTQLAPSQSFSYELLGDALLESGDYEQATAAFMKMEQLGSISVNTETRLARLALLHGDNEGAKQRYSNAITLALELSPPEREIVAWCQWQLGETAFATGDYETAERLYRDALTTFPDYRLALASLGRARAARGDLADGIDFYKRAIRVFPDPLFVAALGDLYKLTGQDRYAATQYALVEKIERLSMMNGSVYSRQLALFYADHDLRVEEAYANASKEYAVRRDVYGADAVAWTALKAGKVPEAQAEIKKALSLGTQDAKLFYHAGMIARAAGNDSSARDYLNRALMLNPQFDPLQASIAKRVLLKD